jgi:ferredoxin
MLNKEPDSPAKFDVPGNLPYKQRKPSKPDTPITGDACIECGICARNCPTGAIDFNDFSSADPSLCIKCCSCIKKCPSDAKSFSDGSVVSFSGWLEANCSERKQPELFTPVI